MPRLALVLLLSALSGCATPVWAGPLPESAAGRRAIRGSTVEVIHESDELRQLREFDEQSFPRPLPGMPSPPVPDDSQPARRASLAVGAVDAPSSPSWLSQLNLPDLPVRLDPRVVRYLEFYKNDRRGRAIMTSWLKKVGRWREWSNAMVIGSGGTFTNLARMARSRSCTGASTTRSSPNWQSTSSGPTR